MTSPELVDRIAAVVSKRLGLAIEAGQRPDLEKAARASAKDEGRELPEFVAALEQGKQLPPALVRAATVKETYFFRDPFQFDFLEREVLPQMRAHRGPLAPVRVWSAGCSTGEEAWSLAIVLRQAGLARPGAVLATDVASWALEVAKEGRYSAWSLRGSGAERARRHLRREGNELVVPDVLRPVVDFRLLNLAEPVYPSPANGTAEVDVIFCRNVLLYLRREALPAVAERLFRSLRPGGWLFLGPSDPALSALAPFAHPTLGPQLQKPLAATPRRPELRSTLARRPPARIPSPAAESTEESLRLARDALAKGRYEEAAREAAKLDDPRAAAVEIRALANLGKLKQAHERAEAAARAHPFAVEVAYLRALLLAELHRYEEAEDALRGVLYLDPRLAVAHQLRASLLERRGERVAALKALRTARELTEALPPDAKVPLSYGESAASLTNSLSIHLSLLGGDRHDGR